MATYTTYDTVGIKEDVSDIITNLTPTKTPFQTLIGSEKTRNRQFQWLEDSLRAVQVNAKVEGFTAADATITPPVLRSNYTQILEKTVKIAATEDAVDQYGRAKETAYQLSKASAELKRDVEHAYVGVVQAAVVGDSTVTARRTASAFSMIGAGTTVTTDVGAGAAGPLTEANLLSVGQKCYNEGSDPSVLMIKPADSTLVADFAKASGRERDFGASKSVVNVVNLYVSPFGEYKVVLNRFMKTTHALLIDPGMWSEVVLRPFTRETLAKDGDSSKHMIVGERGLKHRNFLASGMIANLT